MCICWWCAHVFSKAQTAIQRQTWHLTYASNCLHSINRLISVWNKDASLMLFTTTELNWHGIFLKWFESMLFFLHTVKETVTKKARLLYAHTLLVAAHLKHISFNVAQRSWKPMALAIPIRSSKWTNSLYGWRMNQKLMWKIP